MTTRAAPGASDPALDPSGPGGAGGGAIRPPVLFFAIFALVPLLPKFPDTALERPMEAVGFLLVSVLASIGLLMIGNRLPRSAVSVPLVFALLFLCITGLALLRDASRLVYGDFIELLKPVAIVLMVVFTVSLTWSERAVHRYYLRAVKTLFAASVFVTLPDALAIPGLERIDELYVRGKGVLSGKAVAFFFTTYFAGSVYLLFASIFLAGAMIRRSVPLLLLATIALALCVFTQSRSVFVAVTVVCAYAALLFPFVARPGPAGMAVYGALVLAFIYGVVVSVNYLSEQFPYLASGVRNYIFRFDENVGRTSTSLGARFSQLEWAFRENSVPLVGAGIGKGYNRLLESYYALYYYRYGVVGILLYLSMWGACFWVAATEYRWARRLRRTSSATALLGVHLFLVGLPFLSLSSAITDQIHVFGIFYGSMGVVFGIHRYRRSRERALVLASGDGGAPARVHPLGA